jgi:hypothetical protein
MLLWILRGCNGRLAQHMHHNLFQKHRVVARDPRACAVRLFAKFISSRSRGRRRRVSFFREKKINVKPRGQTPPVIRELQMLWKLVKDGERRPLSAADLALLLRIRFALQEYEAKATPERGRGNV